MASTRATKPQPIVVEAFVLTSMALTTLALGTALHLHGGFEILGAGVAALAAYALMLVGHGVLRRVVSAPTQKRTKTSSTMALDAEADNLAARVAAALEALPEEQTKTPTQKTAAPSQHGASVHEQQPTDTAERHVKQGGAASETQRRATPEEIAAAFETPPNPFHEVAAQKLVEANGRHEGVGQGDGVPSHARLDVPPPPPTSKPHPPVAAQHPGSEAPPKPMAGSPRQSAPPPPPLPDLPPAQYAPGPERALPDPAPPRPADVEMIQGLIKKLADEVNAASFEDTQGQGATGPPRAPRGHADAQAAGGYATAGDDLAGSQSAPSQSEDFKVDALRAAAGDMRALDHRASTGDVDPSTGAAAAAQLAGEGISQVREAVEAGRVDVLLDPIVGLDDSRMQHFEIALRLRDRSDRALGFEIHGSAMRGTGVYPLVDQLRLEKTCELAHKLQSRGKTGSVFSRTSGESLVADLFLDRVADAYRAHQAFATRLVMTFSQSDVRAFGPREWATLTDMCDLGFRFAIASVSDLDMDFEDLAERGFEFLKLDADVFLNGLPTGEGTVPAADICRHVADLGMSVIVGRIESEEAKSRISGFGVLLGQGALFGAPRVVRSEVMMANAKPSGQSHAAA
ncbi:MAG: EAL domain-containing protein [Pseudomonadota bacterium]